MSKRCIYICHTPYHVLIALIRALKQRPALSALYLSESIPNVWGLKQRLETAGLNTVWDSVVIVDETVLDRENGESAFYRLRHPGRSLFCLPRSGAEIYISNDWSALGRYLQKSRTSYILCEDTMGGTLDPDQHLLDVQRTQADFAQRQASGRGYLYWGDSKYCVQVETEDADRCKLFPQKKVQNSKRELLHSLTGEEKDAVRAVFLTQPLPAVAKGATLLLPRSFVQDGLMDQQTQNAMFRAVAEKYAAGPLFVKTHPRDTTDYGKLFPGAVVLERTMPSEVLNFCLPFRFARAVTVQSWVLRGFEAADEQTMLTLDEALALTK